MQRVHRLMVIATLVSGSFLIGDVSNGTSREASGGPETVVTGWSDTTSPEMSKLLDDLHAAKKAGDMDAAWAIERELARLRGKPLAFRQEMGDADPAASRGLAMEGQMPPDSRWVDNDVLIRGSTHGEIRPVIAGTSTGTLYAAWQHDDEYRIMIYRSPNGGDYWTFWAWVYNASVYHGEVTMAVGEGVENWLLVAYRTRTTRIILWRFNLDDPSEYPESMVYECPDSVSNPRIVTDSAEFPGWYAYVVFNARTVDGWAVCATRSIDFGQTWQATPDIIGWHCPGWDAAESRPDLDFGSDCLYAAYGTPVPPCSDENTEIFVNRSTDYGATWSGALQLTTNGDMEHSPTVGAIKNSFDLRTVVVAYARYFDSLDEDVWYAYTQDGGATWYPNRCLSCLVAHNETAPDLETSFSLGALHAAYWHDSAIDYRRAAYDAPTTWVMQTHINDGLYASAIHPRPGVAVNPMRTIEEEAGICWTDERNLGMQSYDVYYDGPAAAVAGVPETGGRDPHLLVTCGPNPFTEATSFRFDLPEASEARLVVLDVTGRVLRTLAEGRQPAGTHTVTWNGLGMDGMQVPAGVYLIRLETVRGTAERSVTVLR